MLNSNISTPYARAFRQFLRTTQNPYSIHGNVLAIQSGLLFGLNFKLSDNYITVYHRDRQKYQVSFPYDHLSNVLSKLVRYKFINLLTLKKLVAL